MTFQTFFGHDIDFSKAATMFSIHHLIYATCGVCAIIVATVFGHKIKAWKNEKQLKTFLLLLLIVLEVSYHIHNFTYPRFSLPLHICSFAVFLNIWLLLTDNKDVFRYAFFFGTLGGFMALFFPNSYGYTYLNFRYYHFMILHTVIIFIPLYYYRAYQYRIEYHDVLEIYRNVFILAVFIYIINLVLRNFGIDANYWFISVVPENVDNIFTNYHLYVFSHLSAVFLSMNILYFLTHYLPKWTHPYIIEV